MKRLISFILFFSLPLHATDLFSYKLEKFPTDVEGCKRLGDQLAERFVEATDVELYSVGVTNNKATCDFEFGYLADERVQTVESIDRNGFSAEPYQAAYPTQEDCEAQLERESNLLEEQTGLTPWISYCYKEDRMLSWQRFVPFVQALGSSETRLFKASSSVWLRPLSGWDGFNKNLFEEIKTTKLAKVVSVSYDPGMVQGDRELILRFYSKERHWLRVDGYAPHQSPDVCQSQITRVREKLREANTPPLLVYCGKRLGRKHELALIELRADILSMSPIKASRDPKQFGSLEECVAALDTVEKFYKEKLQRSVLAGFCGGNDSYQITLFENRKQKS